MEHMSIWKREGYEEGVQYGMQHGVAEVILRQLKLRIGGIGVRTQNQIKHLPSPRLQQLAEDIFAFKQKADLVDWLKNNS